MRRGLALTGTIGLIKKRQQRKYHTETGLIKKRKLNKLRTELDIVSKRQSV